MKRILSVLLTVALLCSLGCGHAESFLDKSAILMDMINKQLYLHGLSASENLFTGIYENIPEENYIFSCDVMDIHAQLIADRPGGEFSRCIFATASADKLLLALNCCSFIPLITAVDSTTSVDGWITVSDEVYSAYDSMLSWGESVYENAASALKNGLEYEAPLLKTDIFTMELSIIKEAELCLATITYSFSNTNTFISDKSTLSDNSTGIEADISNAYPAEFKQEALNIFETINAMVLYYGLSNYDPLFSELYPGEASGSLRAVSSATDLTADLYPDPDTGKAAICSFSTTSPKNLIVALNCCYYLPAILLGEPTEDENTVDMDEAELEALDLLEEWGKIMMLEGLQYFVVNESFEAPVVETDYFRAELRIASEGASSTATVIYYFRPDIEPL